MLFEQKQNMFYNSQGLETSWLVEIVRNIDLCHLDTYHYSVRWADVLHQTVHLLWHKLKHPATCFLAFFSLILFDTKEKE